MTRKAKDVHRKMEIEYIKPEAAKDSLSTIFPMIVGDAREGHPDFFEVGFYYETSSASKRLFSHVACSYFDWGGEAIVYFFDPFVDTSRDVPFMIQRLVRPENPDFYPSEWYLYCRNLNIYHLEAIVTTGVYFEWGFYLLNVDKNLFVLFSDDEYAKFYSKDKKIIEEIRSDFSEFNYDERDPKTALY